MRKTLLVLLLVTFAAQSAIAGETTTTALG